MSSTVAPKPSRRDVISFFVAAIVSLFVCASLFAVVPTDKPLSIVDEHVHFDYALHIHDGTLPYRGSLFSQEVVDEWACGVGHEAGPLPVACGANPGPTASDLPSGEYSTAYIHYPTYFIAAEAFRQVIDAVAPATTPLQAYRYFSALCVSLGILALGFGAALFGIRGARALTLLTAPIAASGILFMGVIVNPGSTAILSGALIAIAGAWWMRAGRGFLWLLAATLAASVTAVTNVLPSGAFMIAILAALIGRRFGWAATTNWIPRLWHLILLGVVVIVPIFAWGRYIAATATVGNDALYSFAAPSDVGTVVAGLISEITSLHTPWIENQRLIPDVASLAAYALRIPASGIALWLTILVFGALVYVAVKPLLARKAALEASGLVEPRRATGFDPLLLLIAGAVATIFLYPPALRLSNVITFGFDFGIVNRYSVAFTPLLVLLLVLTVNNRAYVRIVGLLGAVAAIGLSVSWA